MNEIEKIVRSIEKRMIGVEIWFKNHDKHHQRVILPFLITGIILLVAVILRQ